MKKSFKLYVVAWLILLAVFNVICFATPNEAAGMTKFGGAFWAGYIFITIAFIGQLFCASRAFNAGSNQRFFYNMSLIKISYSGLVMMLVFGGLVMIIPDVTNWVGIILCLLILAFNAVAVIKATVAIEEVERIDQKVKAQTFFIKSLTVDADTLMAQAQTDAAKAECKKVYEAIRFSDPMSNAALASAEGQITVKFAEFSDAVKIGDGEKITTLSNELLILIGDRNKKCKLLK